MDVREDPFIVIRDLDHRIRVAQRWRRGIAAVFAVGLLVGFLSIGGCAMAADKGRDPLPELQETHFFVYVACGHYVAAFIHEPGKQPRVVPRSSIRSNADMERVLESKDEARADGHAHVIQLRTDRCVET